MTPFRASPVVRNGALVFFTLYLASLLGWLAIPTLYRPLQPLEPYVTVITDRTHDEAARALEQAGATDVITPASTRVAVSRFHDVELVSLEEALAQLDPLDPRRDPWIEDLRGYFTIDGRNALYARFDAPLVIADRTVRRALGPTSRVAEWSSSRVLWALVLFAAFAIGGLLVYGPRRTRLAASLLPWLPAVVFVGLPAAVAAGGVLFYLALSAREMNRVRMARSYDTEVVLDGLRIRLVGLLFAVTLSVVYALRLAGWRAALVVLVAAFGSFSVVVAATLASQHRRDTDHKPFVPVSILSGGRAGGVDRRLARMALIALPILLFAPPLIDVVVSGGASRPVPRAVSGHDLEYEALSGLWGGLSGGELNGKALPDLADYLAHRAYQEGLVYGRSYGFPLLDETVQLSRYQEQTDGSYARSSEAVITYDRAWVDAALADPPAGVASMLAGLGYAAGVVLSPTDTIYSGYPQFLQHLAYVVLVLAPFLLAAVPWVWPIRARGSIVELTRRRRQVA